MSAQSQTTPRNKRWTKKANVDEAVKKQEEIKNRLEANQVLADNAPPPPSGPKKDKFIDTGKKIISKFFKGYSSVERANVTAEFDSDVSGRLVEGYYDSISEYVHIQDPSDIEDHIDSMVNELAGAVDLGIALKAANSAPDDEKKALGNLFCLKEPKLPLPQKLAVAVDSIGKTDLGNENRFRLNQQNLVSKRHLVRSFLGILKRNVIEDYLVDSSIFDYDSLHGSLFNSKLFHRCIDNSSRSLDRVHKLGRELVNIEKDKDIFVVTKDDDQNDRTSAFRLPNLVIDDDSDVTDILNYWNNQIFEEFKIEYPLKFVAATFIAVAKPKWLRESNKPLNEIEISLRDQPFAKHSFKDLMTECNIWNINDYFTDHSINELGNEAIHVWNTSKCKKFQKFLTLTEVSFSAFGSPAQLVQVEANDSDKPKLKNEKFDKFFSRFKGKRQASTPLVVNEYEASLGISLGFTSDIRIDPTFTIEFDSYNENIFHQFIKSDFK